MQMNCSKTKLNKGSQWVHDCSPLCLLQMSVARLNHSPTGSPDPAVPLPGGVKGDKDTSADLPILMCSTGSVPPSLKHFAVIQSWLEFFCRRTFSVVNLKFNKNWLPLTTPPVSLWPYEIFTETISLAPSPRRSLTPSFIKNSPVKHLSAVISEWNTGIPISERTWGFHRTHNSFTAEFSVGKELPCSLDLIHIDNRMLDNSAEYWQNQRNTEMNSKVMFHWTVMCEGFSSFYAWTTFFPLFYYLTYFFNFKNSI